ncbi:MAG: RluA family pseudouridine synthase [Verrucomicrobia bacterium]|nr:RluA family pseudouridine synthase [Verrucomicrobiota bacterium]MBV8376911.1 RluA family pseudouridine synthase [Verrucomicrobiota bacterium]
MVYEDHRFLVIDKPANLLVHPTGPGGPDTLWAELKRVLAFEIVNGARISFINRLDRETSGLILVAKTTGAARQLGLMIAGHRIHRKYIAIVAGWPSEGTFLVNQPLLRQGMVRPSKIWLKQAVHPGGSPALTSFHVLNRFTVRKDPFALVEAKPKTGKTHQIRVHLAHVGHPIVGDKIYGPDENCYLEFIASDWTPSLAAKLLLPRQALHAFSLSFEFEGDFFSFEAPLPPDLQRFIAIGE